MSHTQLFIIWASFQRRAVSMQNHFNYDLKLINLSFSSKLFRPLEYLLKSVDTLFILLKSKPSIVWIQLPPTLILHVIFLYKLIFNRSLFIIADCHNATFRKPWINIPGFRFLLEKCSIVLVHNDAVKQSFEELNIFNIRVDVLEDPPASLKPMKDESISVKYASPWIICPCSFNKDEPINAILAAAQQVPEITFVLTGNKNRALVNHHLTRLPSNVKLPGFLPVDEFDGLFQTANVVLGLTRLDGIQLSVANEAVGVGKPLVLSNTKTLRRLFHKGAVYVEAEDASSIAAGCREAISNQAQLAEDIRELRQERQLIWLKQAQAVEKMLAAEFGVDGVFLPAKTGY
jgi:glycosyltransferase involved in cell wall biosynthesis